jgi:pimeloyl-ACP methyl ester carboxylesterase
MRRVLSVVAAAVLVSAGLATASAQARTAGDPGRGSSGHRHHPGHTGTPAYTPPPVDWGTCPTASLQAAGAQCGYVTVPLDYAHPSGRKIQLYVSRVAHKTSDADAQGPMLVNPGGPGGSGLSLSRLGQFVPDHGGDPYDWIGFDPRGVGRSIPSLSCDPSYFAPGRPAYEPGPGTKRFWLDKAAGYSDDCAEAGGALLSHDKTTDWVNDMESIRKALGAEKINYYGFSYGTYLGQVYATLHPHRVGRFVLDGVIGASQVWYQLNLAQERQFDPNIDTFFDWVADNDASYGLGTSGRKVRRIYYDTLAELTAHPQADFGPSDWNDVFVGAAYYVFDWDTYAHVLAAAAKGDLGPAKDAYGSPDDSTYASYLAVECSDARWPSWRTQERDAYRVAAKAPFLAWNNTWYNAPCLTWPAKSATPVHVDGRKVPPILMIEETNDAATPFAGALEARRTFPRSVMIEGVGGTTHAGSLSGVACTDDKIADYLLTGDLPRRKPGNRSDAQCDPVPPPTPTPVAATAKAAPSGSATHDRLGALRKVITEAAMPQP